MVLVLSSGAACRGNFGSTCRCPKHRMSAPRRGAPLGPVGTAAAVAAKKLRQEIVRIAVVSGPAEENRPVAVLGARAVEEIAPVEGDDRRLDADLGKIGFDHLGAFLPIGIVGA